MSDVAISSGSATNVTSATSDASMSDFSCMDAVTECMKLLWTGSAEDLQTMIDQIKDAAAETKVWREIRETLMKDAGLVRPTETEGWPEGTVKTTSRDGGNYKIVADNGGNG